MASIAKNKSGNWKAIVRKKGWPTTSKTFKTKRDAQDWSRRIEDEMVRGVYIDRAPSERMTLRSAITRYLAEVSPTKASGSQSRETSTSKPLLDHLGDYSMAAITPQLVSEYRDKRLNTINRFGRKMSADQVRLELALLSNLFTVATREWGVGLIYNPVAQIKKPKPAKGRDRRLSVDEGSRLLAECRKHSNPMLYWIVKLALETAMRKSEILNLRRCDVDLGKSVVYLRFGGTKNDEARDVALTDGAVNILQSALNHVRPFDSDLIFWGDGRTKEGKRTPYEFDTAWQSAKKSTGIIDFRFHDLRHEAISRLVESGLSDQEVAALSGHKSMQMLHRYTHLRGEFLVPRLGKAIGKEVWPERDILSGKSFPKTGF